MPQRCLIIGHFVGVEALRRQGIATFRHAKVAATGRPVSTLSFYEERVFLRPHARLPGQFPSRPQSWLAEILLQRD
jgi:hypothetical protein